MNHLKDNGKHEHPEWHEHRSETIPNITFTGYDAHYNNVIKPLYDLYLTNLPETASLSDSPHLSETVMAKLAAIILPVEIKLYIASQCPHCPGAVRTIIPLAAACRYITLKIIDGTIATEEAAADKIMSVPSLIIDNGFRLTGGVVNADEVVDVIVNMVINRDPSSLTTSSLKMILEDGKAQWIAQQMVDHNKMFDAFTGLVTHQIWSVRLGAMVVLESIAEKSPELALSIAPGLMNILISGGDFSTAVDIPTQGDILYALGEIGNADTRDEIIKLMEGQITHPDVLEAAKEAVESIESRL